MPKVNRCSAKTTKGNRCRGNCLTGADTCIVHSVKMTVCDMCEAPMTQLVYDEQDGYCSYACQSGGGKPASGRCTDCSGCAENQPNQLAHMGPGGCLEEREEVEEEVAAEAVPSPAANITVIG